MGAILVGMSAVLVSLGVATPMLIARTGGFAAMRTAINMPAAISKPPED